MNELELSNDLTQITTEIKTYQSIGGQAIFEIGRRLKKVKEENLAHGQYINWLESIKMDRSTANKFIKVYDELPNVETFLHSGVNALYEIATMPEEEREKPQQLGSGETKTPDEMTVRELRELKQQLKHKDKQIAQQARMIDDLNEQEPQVIEKEVEKIPEDYKELKQQKENFESQIDSLKERNSFIESEYESLLKERKNVNEKSDKYDQLSRAIEQAEGKLNQTQHTISNYKRLSDLLRKSNDFLTVASGLIYQDLSDLLNSDRMAKKELEMLIGQLEDFLNDLKRTTKNTEILEGEIINE